MTEDVETYKSGQKVDVLMRENLAIEKERKFLKTKLERLIQKDEEKDEKIG